MVNLNRVLEKVRMRGFRDLDDTRIRIVHDPKEEDYFALLMEDKNRYSLSVGKDVKIMPLEAVIGGIAHELSHVVIERGFSEVDTLAYHFLYHNLESYRISIEAEADKLTIKRGFGKELLALARFDYNPNEPWNPLWGLNPERVRAMLSNCREQ